MPCISTQTCYEDVPCKNISVQVDYRTIVSETLSETSENDWDMHSSSQSADGRHDSDTESLDDSNKEYDQCTYTQEIDGTVYRCENYKNYATQICSDCRLGKSIVINPIKRLKV